MNEPEILEAYSRLSAPISAPDDVLATVDRRIRRRRTARRGVAAVATLAVAGGIGFATLGGSDGGATNVAEDAGGDYSSLTYTDTDGSTHTFDAKDIGIACTTQDRSGDQVEVLTLTNNTMVGATAPGEGDPDVPFTGDAVLHVELLLSKVRPGQVFDLPYDSRSGSSETRAMTFFFTNGIVEGSNELNSGEAGSSGTVTLHEATCGPSPSLWIEIDGVLGSEVEQPAMAIVGEYRS